MEDLTLTRQQRLAVRKQHIEERKRIKPSTSAADWKVKFESDQLQMNKIQMKLHALQESVNSELLDSEPGKSEKLNSAFVQTEVEALRKQLQQCQQQLVEKTQQCENVINELDLVNIKCQTLQDHNICNKQNQDLLLQSKTICMNCDQLQLQKEQYFQQLCEQKIQFEEIKKQIIDSNQEELKRQLESERTEYQKQVIMLNQIHQQETIDNTDKIQSLLEQVQELQKFIQSNEQKDNESKKEISSIKNAQYDVDALTRQTTQLNQQIADLQAASGVDRDGAMDALRSQLTASRESEELLRQQVEALQDKCENLDQIIGFANVQNAKKKTSIETLDREVEDLKMSITNLSQLNMSVNQDADVARQTNEELVGRVHGLKTKLAEATKQLHDARTDNADLEATVDSLQEQYEAEAKQLSVTIEELKKQLSQRSSEDDVARGLVEEQATQRTQNLQQEIATLKQASESQAQQKQKEIESLTRQTTQLNQQIADLQAASGVENSNKQLQVRVLLLEKDNNELNQIISILENQGNQLKSTVYFLDQEIETFKIKISQLCELNDTTITQLQFENEQLKEKLGEYQTQLTE
uniref:Uncharacterized protein n=1 Tax=Spironucleus salmonicida TaxID=348837 RepID=V6LHF1_9EUKA|eukprot:EST43141.1 hypothetical protein SS50377_17198 [Spironucleus salmonicida]